MANPDLGEDEMHVGQWEPYEDGRGKMEDGRWKMEEGRGQKDDVREVLQALVDWMARRELTVLHGSTQIIIAPGYDYHIVKMLITNFHQPQSTLLLLVSAFVKGDWRRIYDYALTHDFRFLSYGDSSLLMS
jgi:S-adenosylmethionine:tRNA ribosyltransferase-isomerase